MSTGVAGDHPRSRGVYHGFPHICPDKQGSSPLARGLHNKLYNSELVERIIPARAGFTRLNDEFVEKNRDHPRSRGVYLMRWSIGDILMGSSPLARGLPDSLHVLGREPRIIPARAGFTWCTAQSFWLTWDHPRSRGVYASSGRRVPVSQGSSPLARGLLRRRRRVTGHVRIIPARAGFTCGSSR